MRSNCHPSRNPSYFLTAWAVGIGLFQILTSCQSSSSDDTAPLDVSATVIYKDDWKKPDSLTWAISSGPRQAVTSQEINSSTITAHFSLPAPTSDTIYLGVWAVGMRIGVVPFLYKEGSSNLAYQTSIPDSVALNLLMELAAPQLRNRDSLYQHYAKHLLEGDTAYEGFPKNCPIGIDTAVVLRTALAMAVAKKVPLSLLAKTWILGIDTTSLHVRIRNLVKLGLVAASDTIAAFPPYPVRILVPVSVSDLQVGQPVAIKGKFVGDSGLSSYDAKIVQGSVDRTPLFKLSSSIKHLDGRKTTWDLQTDAALTISDSIAPPGTYTILAWVTDSKGRSDTSLANFKVLAIIADPGSPRISLIAPAQNSTFGYQTSSVSAKWIVRYSGTIDSVRIAGKQIASTNDSIYSRNVPLTFVGSPTLIDLQVFTPKGRFSDTVRTTRLAPEASDSTVTVSFDHPGRDTTVSYSTNSLAVIVQAYCDLRIDSVTLNGSKMTRGKDSISWMDTVNRIDTGTSNWKTIAYSTQAKRNDTAILKVTKHALPGIDSSVTIAFSSPAKDTSIPNASTSIALALKTNSVFRIDSVTVNGAKLTKTADTSLWAGSASGLVVGSNPLKAIAYSSRAKRNDTAIRKVTRRDIAGFPAFSPVPGTYATAQWVKLSDSTKNAELSFSFDGLVWVKFTDSIRLATPDTMYARATLPGRDTTNATAIYVIRNVAAATFSPPEGKYSSALSVTLSCSTPGSSLQYSTDNSSWTAYTSAVQISSSVTLYAKASRSGMTAVVDSAIYRIVPIVKPPRFSLVSGIYTSQQVVTITDSTAIATIQISSDSLVWTPYTQPLVISSPRKLYARAVATGMDTSYSSANYVIAAAPPSFSIPSGIYTRARSIQIITPPGAKALYSTDSTSWKPYTTPVLISSSSKLYAYDTTPGLAPSTVSVATYTFQVDTPTFSPPPGTYGTPRILTLSDSTPGASIYYSTDSATWQLYASGTPIPVNSSGKLYAKAALAGQLNSVVAKASYVILDLPQFTNKPGTLSLAINQSCTLSLGLVAGKTFPIASRVWKLRTGAYKAFTGDTIKFKVPWSRDGKDTLVVKATNTSGFADSLVVPIQSAFTDLRDKQSYNRVQLGGKIWMGSDLNYDAGAASSCLNGIALNCPISARVYRGVPASASICPSGWRLPTALEWRAMIYEVSNKSSDSILTAAQLKSIQDTSVGGTNLFGFSIATMFSRSTGTTNAWTTGSGAYLSTTTSINSASGSLINFFSGLSVGATSAYISQVLYYGSWSTGSSGAAMDYWNKARCLEAP